MPPHADHQATRDLIERMKLARVGEYKRWAKLAKKMDRGIQLSPDEVAYVARMAGTYRSGVAPRSRIIHTKLSPEDPKPRCSMCGDASLYYCGMNDAYFCQEHVVGHDENES